jgi:heptosyltransferase-2
MSGNILIRGVNWIGDAVMTMPALRAIRKAMPEDAVSLLVKPRVAPLFEQDPSIDEIVLYDERYRGLPGRLRLARELRNKRFSLSILLQNAFDAALIAFLAGIPRRVGYSRDMRGLMLTDPVPCGNEDLDMHHVEYYLELLRRAGIEAETSEPWIYLSLEERQRAREKLSGLKRPLIGIHPGASYGSAKQWLPERFAEVAERVTAELDGSVVIYGGASEKGLSDEIIGRFRGRHERVLSMAGKTGLRELASLFSESDLLVTNDSGPMHICYAVRTPLVAIFGSTDPNLTGPPEDGSIVIRKDLECAPCFLRRCPKKRIECMESITSEEVFGSIRKLLPLDRAVFFDRDGTLCVDADYLNNWDDFKVIPDIISVNLLKDKGFKLIGITNQSGIARGIVDEKFAMEVNGYFMEKHGFDDFYHCPHHPDEGCACRKPSPEMLLRARTAHGIDLRGSYMIGDKDIDMLLARAVGATAVLVQTGAQKESRYADHIAGDLKEAVRLILGTTSPSGV